MAIVVLTKQLSTDEIMEILKNGFPNFVFEKKSPFLIECNTGLGGKFNVNVSGMSINIVPKIPLLLGLILVFSLIGILLIIGMSKNPTAVAIANYLKENQDNSEISTQFKTEIPDTCPNCKNPNTMKIRLCEWCGNQII